MVECQKCAHVKTLMLMRGAVFMSVQHLATQGDFDKSELEQAQIIHKHIFGSNFVVGHLIVSMLDIRC